MGRPATAASNMRVQACKQCAEVVLLVQARATQLPDFAADLIQLIGGKSA